MNTDIIIMSTIMGIVTKRLPEEDLAFLRLLHLADSALPIGALAHSFGLELLAAHGWLTPARLSDFLQGYIEDAGGMEATFCREAFRLVGLEPQESLNQRWIAINQRLSALKPARESRAGSGALGQHFLAAAMGVAELPQVRDALVAARQAGAMVHHGPAFGLVAGALGVDEHRAVLAYLHQSIASLVSACQRLLPIGQGEATRILWGLKPLMVQVASRDCRIEDVSCFTPMLDWGAMEHPALETRLFIS